MFHACWTHNKTSRDHPLPLTLPPLLHAYARRQYGAWIEGGTSLPNYGEVFSFWGRCYTIPPSSMSSDVGQGLFMK